MERVKDVLFIHVPKTGGTTIWNTLGIVKTRNAQRGDFTPLNSGWVSFGHGAMRDMLELEMVTPEFLERAFKFSFVRNPYDRVASHFAFSTQTRKFGMHVGMPFSEYVKPGGYMQTLSNHRPQSRLLKGPPELDFLGRFENFEADLQELAYKLGIGKIEIPHLNPSKRGHWSEIIYGDNKKIVEEFYAEDFENFGYDIVPDDELDEVIRLNGG